MRKERLLMLLEYLKKAKLKEAYLEKILAYDEEILELINQVEQSKKEYIIQILLNEDLKKEGLIEAAIQLITKNVGHEFNAEYACGVLTNTNAIEANIAIEGAKIINEAEHGFNAEYACGVLTNSNAIKAGIALEGAKIVNEAEHGFNAEYANDVLMNLDAVEAGIALEGAKIINELEYAFNAQYACDVLMDLDAIEAGIALEGSKIISLAKEEEIAEQIYNYILRNATNDNILEQAKQMMLKLNSKVPTGIDGLLTQIQQDQNDEISVAKLIKTRF